MLSTCYENYRKELGRYHNRLIISAVIKKNFPSEEEMPYYSLDVEVEILPKTDEEIEKNVVSQLYKSYDFDIILSYYEKIQKFL